MYDAAKTELVELERDMQSFIASEPGITARDIEGLVKQFGAHIKKQGQLRAIFANISFNESFIWLL